MPTKTITSNPVDALLPAIAETVAEWKVTNSPETIKRKVNKILDESSKEIVMKLLGFNNRWDKDWDLDHCNGRAGNSTAGDFIVNANAEAVKEWLTEVSMPALDTKTKNKLLKDAANHYHDTLQRRVRAAIETRATKDADTLIATLSTSTDLDNYLKVMKLLNPSEEV